MAQQADVGFDVTRGTQDSGFPLDRGVNDFSVQVVSPGCRQAKQDSTLGAG
ncbi:MAG: hypothetical protein M1489_01000 [Firmicutes bacterium]|nr:hypothetical protein [Bacillota bacterium]